MLIFSLDTSSSALSLAIVDESGVVAESSLARGRQTSEVLLPLTESLLAATGLLLTDMDALAITIGPGSFTGLRIGLATVKAWVQLLNKPLLAISSLEALAFAAFERGSLVCPLLNARRGELYTALFEDGLRLFPDMAVAPAQLAQMLTAYERPIIFCGDGLAAEGEVLRQALGENMLAAPEQRRLFMAAAAGLLAREKYQRGEFAEAAALELAYLRLPEAEEKRLAREAASHE